MIVEAWALYPPNLAWQKHKDQWKLCRRTITIGGDRIYSYEDKGEVWMADMASALAYVLRNPRRMLKVYGPLNQTHMAMTVDGLTKEIADHLIMWSAGLEMA